MVKVGSLNVGGGGGVGCIAGARLVEVGQERVNGIIITLTCCSRNIFLKPPEKEATHLQLVI
jgi:hypothetical protein